MRSWAYNYLTHINIGRLFARERNGAGNQLYLEYSITEWNIPFIIVAVMGSHMKSDKIRPFTIDVCSGGVRRLAAAA